MKNQLKIISVIIGTMIGAGFASGKELYLFFGQYGYLGILGVFISCFLTSFLIYRVFSIIHEKHITNYCDFLKYILGNYAKNSFFFGIINSIIQIFLLISFFIMVAGFGAYFSQELHLSSMIGCIFIAFSCLLIFNHNVSGIVKVNTILIPFLVVFIFFLGVKNIDFLQNSYFSFVNTSSFDWLIAAILYSSYNSILLVPILIPLCCYMENKKTIFSVCTKTFLIFSLLSFAILSLLPRIDIPITQIEIPMLYVTRKLGNLVNCIYGFIILIAIFTSAVSAGYSFLQNIENKKIYKLASIVICITSLVVSNIGFSQLVTFLYPIFGYLGIIQILLILLKKTKKTDIKEKKKIRF